MRTFCELYVRHVLPSLRLYLAERLVKDYGLTQLETSRMLGISQPLINYFINCKRRPKMLEKLIKKLDFKKELDNIAKQLVEGKLDPNNIACELCTVFKKEGVIEGVIKELKYEICKC